METMGVTATLSFYKGKKVLVTGHTGFKGSWLCIWLKALGAKVMGIGLDPKTKRDNFVLSGIGKEMIDYRADIRNLNKVIDIIDKEKPEILFHLAAQPIVLESYHAPIYTFETNTMGTAHLLEAIRHSDYLKTGVFITTDKCYENIEQVEGYKETDRMGGHDPYSASKGAAELIISSYRRSYFNGTDKKVASARAGNVIGGGDWAAHRLLVDIVKAIESNQTIEVRNPSATRPWQHVLEPLGGYLLLGSKITTESTYDEAWNFGPKSENVVSVRNLLELFIRTYGKGHWTDVSENAKLYEARLLALDISKAKAKLGWEPVLDLQETVNFTADWYKKYKDCNVKEMCVEQINRYTEKWKSKKEN